MQDIHADADLHSHIHHCSPHTNQHRCTDGNRHADSYSDEDEYALCRLTSSGVTPHHQTLRYIGVIHDSGDAILSAAVRTLRTIIWHIRTTRFGLMQASDTFPEDGFPWYGGLPICSARLRRVKGC